MPIRTPPASAQNLQLWQSQLDQARKALDAQWAEARQGEANVVGSSLMDFISPRGAHADQATQAADRFIDSMESAGSVDAQSLARAQELLGSAQKEVDGYGHAKDGLAGVVGGAVSVLGTMAFSRIPGLGAVGAALGSATGSVVGRGAVEGADFTVQQAARAALTAGVAGGVGFKVSSLAGEAAGLGVPAAQVSADASAGLLGTVGKAVATAARQAASAVSKNEGSLLYRAVDRGVRGIGVGAVAGTAAGGVTGAIENATSPQHIKAGLASWASGVVQGGAQGAAAGALSGAVGGLVAAELGRGAAGQATGGAVKSGFKDRVKGADKGNLTVAQRAGIASGPVNAQGPAAPAAGGAVKPR